MKDKPITEGYRRFQIHLKALNEVLEAAQLTSEPAIFIYKSKARQSLFYFQALARIYKGIHNKKRFEKMRLAFKMFEDQLGKIDYYDGFVKILSKNKAVPKSIIQNLKQHYDLELNNLKELLLEHNWINTEKSKIVSIQNELATASWKNQEEERGAIAQVFIKHIEEIEYKYEIGILNFNDLEHGVHEFRRQLRWISIYAQALNGLIQLKSIENSHPTIDLYLTKQVLEGPFNKMPEVVSISKSICFQAANFYALSWMIAESGQLKDEGLSTVCLETVMAEIGLSDKEIQDLLKKIHGNTKRSPKQVKEEMEVITDTFLYDAKILLRLKRDIFREFNN
jgi:hypothetical protein